MHRENFRERRPAQRLWRNNAVKQLLRRKMKVHASSWRNGRNVLTTPGDALNFGTAVKPESI
jgi:hypothetical protein